MYRCGTVQTGARALTTTNTDLQFVHVVLDLFAIFLFYEDAFLPESYQLRRALALREHGRLCRERGATSHRGEKGCLVGLGDAMGGWAFLGIRGRSRVPCGG